MSGRGKPIKFQWLRCARENCGKINCASKVALYRDATSALPPTRRLVRSSLPAGIVYFQVGCGGQ